MAARYRADQYDIPRACSPQELLADAEVEIVINLTPNHLHAPIATEIISAGKHMYSEKPLTVYREESTRLLAAAANLNLRVGAAPDTFFGGAWQTVRMAIDDGLIGDPFAAMASFHGRLPPAAEMDRRTAPRGRVPQLQGPLASGRPRHSSTEWAYPLTWGPTTCIR